LLGVDDLGAGSRLGIPGDGERVGLRHGRHVRHDWDLPRWR
jgi:hypothetical protein